MIFKFSKCRFGINIESLENYYYGPSYGPMLLQSDRFISPKRFIKKLREKNPISLHYEEHNNK